MWSFFRGSGKSTILNLCYSLWSILGRQQKKFVVIISRTKEQSLAQFNNIKIELETNELLKHDLGPFKAESEEWGSHSLELPHFGAKIMMISALHGMRGLRHGPRRPDLIICDDIEDTVSAGSKEQRIRLYQWFMKEVVPAGDDGTKIIVLGNLLHEHSLLMRLRSSIKKKGMKGIFKAYPILDDNNKILWPGRFKSAEDIEKLKRRVGDEQIWRGEYLLDTADEVVIVRGIADYKPDLNKHKPISKGSSNASDYVITVPKAGSIIPHIGHHYLWEKPDEALLETRVSL
jgi:hypothetical protein